MVIDLNTIGNESEEPAEQKERPQESACVELWHACAGGLSISLPRKGSLLVYLPQGHLEQLAGGRDDVLLRYGVPPHVFFRIVDVQLRVEAATDEIYAQLYVVADGEGVGRHIQEGIAELEEEELDDMDNGIKSPTGFMFCKTLKASDTSTHGEFCVPCRAAEDCFPPLDKKLERPCQELVAKDLHGVEWHFRHVYRGEPPKHLLTAGWSAFVNNKKLVAGDSVLFLREDDGKLRLGIRRASEIKGRISYVMSPSQSLNTGIDALQSLANSIAKRKIFQISYYPRLNRSEFIVPYWKFRKSCGYSIPIGTRFKMHCESEDVAARRFTGLITGVSDFDPLRWPGSKWRNLEVKWDDENVVSNNRHNRVSPWEIVPNGSFSSPNGLLIAGSKRNRVITPSISADYPHQNESGFQMLGESVRSHKVFQGQEKLGFSAPFSGSNATLPPQVTEMRDAHFRKKRIRIANPTSFWLVDSTAGTIDPTGNSDFFNKGVDFGVSVRSHKALQGQEMVQVFPPFRGVAAESQSVNGGFKTLKSCIAERSSAEPLDGLCTIMHPCSSSAQVSSPSSVLMFQQPEFQLPCSHLLYESNETEKTEEINLVDPFGSYKASRQQHTSGRTCYLDFGSVKKHQEMGTNFSRKIERNNQSILSDSDSICRLFGFPITEKITAADVMAGSLSDIAVSGSRTRDSPGNSDFLSKGVDLSESVRSHGVLQGQETAPALPSFRGLAVQSQSKNGGFKILKSSISGRTSVKPLEGFCTPMKPYSSSAQVSSPSSVLMFQQPTSQIPCYHSLYETTNEREKAEDINLFVDPFGSFKASGQQQTSDRSSYPGFDFSEEGYEIRSNLTRPIEENSLSILHGSDSSCRIFGFPLTENIPIADVVAGSFNDTPSLISTGIESSFSRKMPPMSTMAAQGCVLPLATGFRNPASLLHF